MTGANCPSGTYPDSDAAAACTACPTGCATCCADAAAGCASAGDCTACLSGYFLDGVACKPVCNVPNCKTCGTGIAARRHLLAGENGAAIGKCQECESGYYLVSCNTLGFARDLLF